MDQGKQVTQVSEFSILEAMKIVLKMKLSWSEVTATAIANWFRKAWFLQNGRSGEDDPLSKLKDSRSQLQQYDKNIFTCSSEL